MIHEISSFLIESNKKRKTLIYLIQFHLMRQIILFLLSHIFGFCFKKNPNEKENFYIFGNFYYYKRNIIINFIQYQAKMYNIKKFISKR